jgi:gliding motility-associated-like protein
MQKTKALFILILCVLLPKSIIAQSFNPVALSGFNCDVIADFPTPPLSTSIAMDLQNNIMYTQTMATFLGIGGGIVDNGTIVSGTSTYQLANYFNNCALHVTIGSSQTLTVNTPAPFAKISLLLLSTESNSNITINAGFTDGTTYNFGNYNVQDWFGGTGAVYCCYGRINRVAAPPYNLSGLPIDPRMYKIDLTMPCAYMTKSLQSVTIGTVSGGTANSSVFVFAMSAVNYVQNINNVVTNVTCNGLNNGSVALTTTGSNTPYSYNWNTAPVQTNATATGLQAGTYICTITDANNCIVKDTFYVTQPAPLVVTASALPDTICSGDSLQLTVSGLTTFSWNPGGLTTTPVTVHPATTTTYTVTGTSANGCSASSTIKVFVNTGVNILITPAQPSICEGDSVQLQAFGALNYTWSPPTGLSSTSIGDPFASPLITTVYTVTGTNPGGCNSIMTDTVYVYPKTIINPVASPPNICNGASTVLSVSGLSNYLWNPGNQTTASVTVTPASSTQFTITGTDGNGCAVSDSVTITIYPNPIVAVTPAAPTICQKDSIQLQANGALTYTWLPTANLSNPLNASTWANPNTTTTYIVTGTNTNGCTATSAIIVNVNTLPIVNATANPQQICAGTATQLTVTGLSLTNWNPGGQTLASISVSPVSSTTYTVTGSDNNGCSGSATVTVTVDNIPAITAATASPVICNGNDAELTVSGNALNYNWNPGGLTNDTIVVTPSASTVYTVTGYSGGNCTASVTVTINVVPFPNAAFTPSVSTGCDPLTVLFNNQSTDAVNWQWLFSNGGTDISQNPTQTFAAGTWDVTLIAANTLGCADTLVRPNLITVYPYPVAAFSPSINMGCEPLEVTFTDQSTLNVTSWQWQLGNGNSATTQNPTEIYTAGNYDVTLIVANSIGCSDTLVQTALLDVYPKPIPSFTVNPDFNTLVELNEATFTFTDNSSNAATYLWNFGDTVTSSLPNPVHTYTATGNYTVSLTTISNNGCIDSIAMGIIEIFQNNYVVLPCAFTPNGDGLNEVFMIPTNPNIKAASLAVYNRWGELIFKTDNKLMGWDGTFKNEPQQEGSYVYQATIIFLNGQQTEKSGTISLIR